MRERLLVLEPVGGQGPHGAGADVRKVDSAGRLERGDIVRLLGDQHRRAGVALAAIDQLHEGVFVERAAVELQPRGDPDRPFVGDDRRQLVEAAELAERPIRSAEQIAHHVLDRAGEQDRYCWGSGAAPAQALGRLRRTPAQATPAAEACAPPTAPPARARPQANRAGPPRHAGRPAGRSAATRPTRAPPGRRLPAAR